MAQDNEGASRLVKSIREQASRVMTMNSRNNMLGTVQGSGIYIDAIEDIIPRSDFLFLQTDLYSTNSGHSACKPTELINGDRVLCVPVGDYFVVLGKVK